MFSKCREAEIKQGERMEIVRNLSINPIGQSSIMCKDASHISIPFISTVESSGSKQLSLSTHDIVVSQLTV